MDTLKNVIPIYFLMCVYMCAHLKHQKNIHQIFNSVFLCEARLGIIFIFFFLPLIFPIFLILACVTFVLGKKFEIKKQQARQCIDIFTIESKN